jgi:hypothetical protein
MSESVIAFLAAVGLMTLGVSTIVLLIVFCEWLRERRKK